MNILYLSYDGMTDQLGQSQVLPYLQGLSAMGHRFTLISFEKEEKFKQQSSTIADLCTGSGIEWIPLMYTKNPPVLSTVWDIRKLNYTVESALINKSYDIIHCRSYITALTGLRTKKEFGVKFIFDMRGLWADERVDGKIWNLKNPVHNFIYRYFKKKEKEFLIHADYIVSLTQNAKDEIENWDLTPGKLLPIKVIPCCADLNLFSVNNTDVSKRNQWKQKLGLNQNDFILTYLGAIGTWYLLDEMLDFFKILLKHKPSSKFLFITHDEHEKIKSVATAKNIPAEKIILSSAARSELPSLLSLSDVSIFFIKPAYSKKASSPTKQGELMGMGIPVICNAGIGDTDKIVTASQSGIIIEQLNELGYEEAIKKTDDLISGKSHIAAEALKWFSLEQGVKSYAEIYRQLQT